jgi:hypothetical protein
LGGEKHLHAERGISVCLFSLLFSFLAFDDPNMMRKPIALHLASLQREIQSLVFIRLLVHKSTGNVGANSYDK